MREYYFKSGEQNVKAKLKGPEVSQIIQLYKNGEMTQTELAKHFKVTHQNISLIVNGVTWRMFDTADVKTQRKATLKLKKEKES